MTTSNDNTLAPRVPHEVTELVLYARNIEALHTRMIEAVAVAQTSAIACATAFHHCACNAAHRYKREFGTPTSRIFSADHILLAASELCEWYCREYRA